MPSIQAGGVAQLGGAAADDHVEAEDDEGDAAPGAELVVEPRAGAERRRRGSAGSRRGRGRCCRPRRRNRFGRPSRSIQSLAPAPHLAKMLTASGAPVCGSRKARSASYRAPPNGPSLLESPRMRTPAGAGASSACAATSKGDGDQQVQQCAYHRPLRRSGSARRSAPLCQWRGAMLVNRGALHRVLAAALSLYAARSSVIGPAMGVGRGGIRTSSF